MHKVNLESGKHRCNWCGKPIYQEFYLVPPDPKRAFETLISMKEDKMCGACFLRLSRKAKSKGKKVEQIDAFPDYPLKYAKRATV